MGFIAEERASDSPYVEAVMRGYTAGSGTTIRPAEIHWHMVLVRHPGGVQFMVVGPLSSSGVVSFVEGIELLWIKLKLGSFMPHLPTRNFVDTETILPEASGQSFWLHSSAWQFPDFENVETFINQLAREGVLARDPLIDAVLQGHPQQMASRTVRHRFLRATGLNHSQILQLERAKYAAALLEQGVPILDTVYDAGYFDQPHLTRSLKQWIGHTPAQIIQNNKTIPHQVQSSAAPSL
jgi:hypothetical protein